MSIEDIIIVDENDECIGSMDKMIVHRNGILHRAFSVLIADDNGNMLLQRRSKYKYHSPLLWSNACCSHQRPGESLGMAATRRLCEELGLNHITLDEIFKLRYRFLFDNSLMENEIDHVFIGEYTGVVNTFNPDEIAQVAWVDFNFLKDDVLSGSIYTVWFKLIVGKLIEKGFF